MRRKLSIVICQLSILAAVLLASCATQKHLQQSTLAVDSTEKVEISRTATDHTQIKNDSTATERETRTETVEVVHKRYYDTTKPADSTGKHPLLAEEVSERRSVTQSAERQRAGSVDSTRVVVQAVDSARTASVSDFSSLLVGSSSSEPAPLTLPLWGWLVLAAATLYLIYKLTHVFRR